MFTPHDRDRLRAALIDDARRDVRITGAAITGSAAAGLEDGWSDIDLYFGVADPADLPGALAAWTARMYDQYGAVHHVDVLSGATVYRVFLLRNTLQVDLAFAPGAEFGARAPTFQLLFGVPHSRPYPAPPAAEHLVGTAWLYALHVRSCIARGQLWRAEYMVGRVRDHVLMLACLRHGLPTAEGRGIDRLPVDITAPLEEALVRRVTAADLARAFRAATNGLLAEIRYADGALARRLDSVLAELAGLAGESLSAADAVRHSRDSGNGGRRHWPETPQ